MNLEKASELMGINAITPEILSESIGAEFSKEDLLKLKEIPIKEPDLLLDDPYLKADKVSCQILKLKNSYILCPISDKMALGNKTVPLNAFQIIQHFGFAKNELRKLFFMNNSVSRGSSNDPLSSGWKEWFFNEKIVSDHPMYRVQKPAWLLMRKSLIPASIGKNLKDGMWSLKYSDKTPTFLEVLVGMIGFYFLIKNSKNSDAKIGMPFYIERDWFGRILSGSMAWTTDTFSLKENSQPDNLTIGLNTPDSGINIEKLDPSKSSEVIGILPLRRLRN